MKKIFFKVFTIFILIIFIVNITNVYAASDSGGLSGVIEGGKKFIEERQDDVSVTPAELSNVSGQVYNILISIAVVVVIVVGIFLGIKFMFAGVDEKADVKKSLIIYVIGSVVVFGAFGIWSALVTILNTI